MKPSVLFLFLYLTTSLFGQPARMWRIVVNECNNLKILELNFITPNGEQPNCNMTANFSCNVSALGTNQEEAFKPFDGLFLGNNGLFVGNLLAGSNYSVGLDFRSSPQFVSGVRFQKDLFNDISTFKIESSNDNVTWKTHKTFSGLSGTWTDSTFFIDNIKPQNASNFVIAETKETFSGLVGKDFIKKWELTIKFSPGKDNNQVHQYLIKEFVNANNQPLLFTLPHTGNNQTFKIEVQKNTTAFQQNSNKGLIVETQDIYGNVSSKSIVIDTKGATPVLKTAP